MNAKYNYVENIRELQESCIEYKLEINKLSYDLESMLIHLKNQIGDFK